MKPSNQHGAIPALITIVLALAIGIGGGYAVGHSKESKANKNAQASSMPTTETKAADLRVLLNGLQQEHVALASTATRAGFDGTANFAPAAASLDQNSHDLAAAVGSVYGKDAEAQFYDIWNSHIGFFVDYTKAAKAGDKAGMDKAVKELNGYVDAISTFFSNANPNLPKDAVATLVSEHVSLLKAAVDSYGSGDIAGSYAKQREAREQISKIANALSGAIVKQKPENFR